MTEDNTSGAPLENKEMQEMQDAYKKRGIQQMSWDEYKAKREKEKKKKKRKLPTHIKFIIGTPFILLFCYGVFFIPWVLYLILTSPEAPEEEEEKTENSALWIRPAQTYYT